MGLECGHFCTSVQDLALSSVHFARQAPGDMQGGLNRTCDLTLLASGMLSLEERGQAVTR
jgi:hypothetical protein